MVDGKKPAMVAAKSVIKSSKSKTSAKRQLKECDDEVLFEDDEEDADRGGGHTLRT